MDSTRENKLNKADSAGKLPSRGDNPADYSPPEKKAKATRQEAQRQREKAIVTKRPPMTPEQLAMAGVETGELPRQSPITK